MTAALSMMPPAYALAAASKPSSAPIALQFTVVEGADGVPLNVVTAGDRSKPAILFVHGIGASYVSWEKQLRSPLTEAFFLVAFDLRGHGNSAKPWNREAYLDYRKYAGDLQAVIKATGIDRPILVGWSYGTSIVADYLRAYGASGLGGIVLTGNYGGLMPPAVAPPSRAARMARNRTRQLSADLEDNIAAARDGVRLSAARAMPPAYWERATQVALMLPAYARRPMLERSRANADQVARITVPLLIVVGGKDFNTPEPQARALAARVTDARVSVYPRSGHSPFAEEPARFNRELATFAGAISSKRAAERQ